MVPEGVRVVSALHTVSAASLTDLDHPLDQDVLVCGDSRADKREAAALIERIEGLRCVDCGRLEMARIDRVADGAADRASTPATRPTRASALTRPARRALGVSARGGRSCCSPAAPAAPSSPAGMPTRSAPERLAVIANTGDDIEIYGAHVSPDPDLVSFWLADLIDERGWGLRGDTFAVMDALRALGEEVWFNLGDRDLAWCLERARLLAEGAHRRRRRSRG